MIDLNRLIASAIKEHNQPLLETLRLIKTEFVNAEKNGVVVDESAELKILSKMAAQHEDSISQYKAGGRQDLVEREEKELEIIKGFLPAPVSEEEISNYVNKVISEIKSERQISMKDMKFILDKIKAKYPGANGKLISDILKSNL